MTSRTLYRAPWVAAMTEARPLIEDGGVLVAAGRILAVDRFVELRSEDARVVEVAGIITPALLNGHCHLELSHLAGLSQATAAQPPASFPDWIREVLVRRGQPTTDEGIRAAAHTALAALAAEGCGVVADIGNRPESHALAQDSRVEVLFFLEFYGLAQAAQARALASLAQWPAERAVTGHSLYSTGETLLKELKKRANLASRPFPIHVAESTAEIRLLKQGLGPFRDFLEERGGWDGSFTPPAVGAVAYLDRLGLLDHRTVCVHGVRVEADEIGLLAKRGAGVCLCPGSNRTLAVGQPPVEAFVRQGVRLALGTDSLASNPELSLWREMRLLREDHPGLAPATIFAMATRSGARVLGLEAEWGELAPGRNSKMLGLEAPRLGTTAEVFDYLVAQGGTTPIGWLH